ncbi:MAG: hypothetical protein LBO08_01435 [Rickettsiales bacterium]|jgi:hypothetical protein|nr:hypothetical protein [Rickettsiales bacterium]
MKLLDKGNFQKIDEVFLSRSLDVFQSLTKIQTEYDKLDTDTFINEVRDSIAAKYLNYTHVNTEKHGFDARRASKSGFDYLEVKTASFDARSWQATFNDTNLEKADVFKQDNIYLALSVWRAASELLFIVYGRNKEIGKFLEDKVKWFKAGNTVRSTQSISISDLVLKYGLKIYAVNKSVDEIYDLLQLRGGCNKIQKENILDIRDL